MEHYLDNSATTQVLRPVAERALELMVEEYGNPSSLHTRGFRARQRVEEARALVAQRLGAQAEEITFTSGGTEANNLALFGAAQARKRLGNKIVTTAAEHDSVLNPCRELEKLGFEVVYVKPDSSGHLPPEALAAAIDQNTILVSCMLVNNETGAIFPVEEAARAIRRSKAPALLHVDAVQAFGKLPFTVKKLGADLLTLSGHKLHAPKGVGALYIRTGVVLPNFIDGGAQERGKRGGTENVASIVGLATAMEQACSTMDQRVEKLTAMRDKLIGEILKIDRSRLNGHPTQRLPGNASFCFQGVEGESLLLMLDLKGISASSGSACTSGSLDPSHVLLAIGLPHEVAHGSLRLSFGDYNTMEDIDYIIETLPPIIERLRSMSPLWDAIQQGRVNYDQYTEQ